METKQVIQQGLEILKTQLESYLTTTLQQVYGEDYMVYMENGTRVNAMTDINLNNVNKHKYKDVLFYLNAFIKNWDFVFRQIFKTNYLLTLCHSIKYFRNRWAHQSQFTVRETYRLLDDCQALLEELSINNKEIDNLRLSVLQSLVNLKSEEFTDINKNQYKIEDEDINMIDIDPNELDNDLINDLNYQKLILDQLNNKSSGFKISEWNQNQ
jgi:hypothetical protein